MTAGDFAGAEAQPLRGESPARNDRPAPTLNRVLSGFCPRGNPGGKAIPPPGLREGVRCQGGVLSVWVAGAVEVREEPVHGVAEFGEVAVERGARAVAPDRSVPRSGMPGSA